MVSHKPTVYMPKHFPLDKYNFAVKLFRDELPEQVVTPEVVLIVASEAAQII